MRTRTVVAAAILFVAVIVGRAVLAPGDGHDDSAATPGVVAATPIPPSPPVPISPSPPPSPSPSASLVPQSAPVVAAAEAWMRTWLNTRGGQPAWLARLQPITDGELYDGLALPGVVAAVPRGTVQPGAQVLTAQNGVTSVRVPTTAGPMLVDLTQRGSSWLVVSNDRAGR